MDTASNTFFTGQNYFEHMFSAEEQETLRQSLLRAFQLDLDIANYAVIYPNRVLFIRGQNVLVPYETPDEDENVENEDDPENWVNEKRPKFHGLPRLPSRDVNDYARGLILEMVSRCQVTHRINF